jgi:hypothetical protein
MRPRGVRAPFGPARWARGSAITTRPQALGETRLVSRSNEVLLEIKRPELAGLGYAAVRRTVALRAISG